MDSGLPSYLKGAKRVSDDEKPQLPSYLSGAKRLDGPAKQNSQSLPNLMAQRYATTRDATRLVGQGASRLAEGFAGLPSDIVQLLGDLTGISKDEQPMSPEEEFLAGMPQGMGTKQVRREAPFKTSKLREASEKLTGGYTSPQSPAEASAGDTLSEIGARFFPLFGQGRALWNILVPIVGEGTKQAIKEAGFGDETDQEVGKLVTEVALDLATGRPRERIGQLYQEANQAARGLSIAEGPVRNALDNVVDVWQREIRLANNPALATLRGIQNAARNGRYTAEQIMQARQAINQLRQDLGHFNVGTGERQAGRRALAEVDQVMNQAIDQMGQVNPQFATAYRNANRANRVYEQTTRIGDYIHQNYSRPLVSKTAGMLFGLGIPAAHMAGLSYPAMAGAAMKGTVGAAAAFPIYKTYQVLHRISASPELARYYAGVLSAAAKNQAEPLEKNMRKLDEALYKLEQDGQL